MKEAMLPGLGNSVSQIFLLQAENQVWASHTPTVTCWSQNLWFDSLVLFSSVPDPAMAT